MALQINHQTSSIGVQGGTLFALPVADGTSGQVLATNGSGGLSFANSARVTIADAAPTSPAPGNGDLWYNSASGRMYVYYTDSNSSQWVDASPDSSGVANIRLIDNISGSFNGSTKTFNLAVSSVGVSPASAQQLIVAINGSVQAPGTSYTVSGAQITFASAPSAGATFSGVLLGAATTLNSVADGAVTTTKIQNGAVTAAKLTIDDNVAPATDNAYNLGSPSSRFANVYTGDLNLSNEGSSNEIDGTWGSYVMQEGKDSLFLINRRTGKRFRFVLEEV